MQDRIANWTASDDAMVENAIRRGANRRELLKMLLLGGVALGAAVPFSAARGLHSPQRP